MSFFSELSRRNVVRVGIAYFAAVWLLLQVADLVLANFAAPDWTMRVLIFAGVLGFPIALLLAWFYELTPDGSVQPTPAEGNVRSTRFLGRKLDFGIITALVLALSFLIVDAYILNDSARSLISIDGEKSIAVLPFVNLTSDPENEYFCDGISEEILNMLTRVTDLKVVGRTSSFAFKGRNEDLRDIGAALGVASLLEGSVRKQGDDVRITVQLIDASDGTHIWSQTYDRTLTDVFAVQDAVAASIIDALQLVTGTAPTRGRPTEVAAAYELFLKARALLNVYEVREAEASVLEALELDPTYAEAYELLARIYWAQAGAVLPAPTAQLLMGRTAGTALTLDSSLVLASALRQAGDPTNFSLAGEIGALETAARLEPENPLILEALIFNLRKAGYLNEALEVAEQLIATDPLSLPALGRWRTTLMAVGRTCEALALISESDELSAYTGGSLQWTTGEMNLALGRDETAIAHMDAEFAERGYPDSGWAESIVAGARERETGLEQLDQQISQILAAVPEAERLDMERTLASLYLVLGYLDRYYDIIFTYELSDSAWTDADDLIDAGILYPSAGFTSHPRYVELATSVGITAAWEERGPPDFCELEDGNWVCESIEARPVSECD